MPTYEIERFDGVPLSLKHRVQGTNEDELPLSSSLRARASRLLIA